MTKENKKLNEIQINQRSFRTSLVYSNPNDLYYGMPGYQLSPLENQIYSAFDIDKMTPEEIMRLQEHIDSIAGPVQSTQPTKSNIAIKFRTVLRKDLYNPLFNKNCEICEEQLNEHDEIGQLACAHAFHTACLDSWFKIYSVCPICKK